MVDFKLRCEYLEKELELITHAYNVINGEHSMMLRMLKLSNEVKPTEELVRDAINSLFTGSKS